MPHKDPEIRSAYMAAYRVANRDRLRQQQQRWQSEHVDEVREYHKRKYRRWMATDPERIRRRNRSAHLAREYQLTPAQYEALCARQEGRCAICGDTPPRPLHVDHDHATGAIRGLLCGRCNRAVGLLRDDPDVARNAAIYLEGFSA